MRKINLSIKRESIIKLIKKNKNNDLKCLRVFLTIKYEEYFL